MIAGNIEWRTPDEIDERAEWVRESEEMGVEPNPHDELDSDESVDIGIEVADILGIDTGIRFQDIILSLKKDWNSILESHQNREIGSYEARGELCDSLRDISGRGLTVVYQEGYDHLEPVLVGFQQDNEVYSFMEPELFEPGDLEYEIMDSMDRSFGGHPISEIISDIEYEHPEFLIGIEGEIPQDLKQSLRLESELPEIPPEKRNGNQVFYSSALSDYFRAMKDKEGEFYL